MSPLQACSSWPLPHCNAVGESADAFAALRQCCNTADTHFRQDAGPHSMRDCLYPFQGLVAREWVVH
jgi:hypothetical protein